MDFKEGDQVRLTGAAWRCERGLWGQIVTINGFVDEEPVFDFCGEEYTIFSDEFSDYSVTLVKSAEETTQEETTQLKRK